MREKRCPCCGRAVLLDDAQLEMHHEAPMCDGWSKLMAEHGAQRSGALVVTNQGAERIVPTHKVRG